MSRCALAILLVAATLLPTACRTGAGLVHGARPIAFSDIRRDPSLAGETVWFRSCFTIPLSSAPHEPEQFALLFPCDHERDESIAEVLVLGRVAPYTNLDAIANVDMQSYETIEANFSGTLSKEALVESDPEKYWVLTIRNAWDAIAVP